LHRHWNEQLGSHKLRWHTKLHRDKNSDRQWPLNVKKLSKRKPCLDLADG
jgi:hypothetical protein